MTDAVGNAVIVDRWRQHLEILQVLGLWTREPHIGHLLGALREVARARGLACLLSPLLGARSIRPYVDAGLVHQERLVPYRWTIRDFAHVSPPRGIELRPAEEGDARALVRLEAECFSPFWRHEGAEAHARTGHSRLVVATEGSDVIGYTLTTLSPVGGTLGRVAVGESARRRGVASALISEATEYAAREGCRGMSLCTQESNDTSRALYASLGLFELGHRLVLAADDDVFA